MISDHAVVVCNAPLVSPIPLPYNSPRFLEFDLPDIDEDLSHPPYTSRQSRSASRKRKADRELELALPEPKRRTPSAAPASAQRSQVRQPTYSQRRLKPTMPTQYYAPCNPAFAASYLQQQPTYFYAAVP
ncbi:hypothetical protein D9611_004541 [Ephemerocybe angulata]|uniref:Uncharacterized protein n=1 Tax=Ephemerocybe angulata TaxID=980116 RepID=A0A8H5BJY0_9AGAR|nr:hypothetical protein D9611_004541 [Tulosesus angulatus]